MTSKLSEQLTFSAEEAIAALGDNVRIARQRRGLSQTALAKKSGVSASTIKRLEAGHAGVSLSSIANILIPIGLERHLATLLSPQSDHEGEALEKLNRPKRIRGLKRIELDTDF